MKRYAVVGLLLSLVVLPPLAILLYLILEGRGLLPAGWPEFDLAGLRLAWDQATAGVGRILDASGRADQTGSPGGVIGGTGAAGAGGTTPPKGHIHAHFEGLWDEFKEEWVDPWEETWNDFKEDVGDLWDELWGEEPGEGGQSK
jgi:hypothetical protein